MFFIKFKNKNRVKNQKSPLTKTEKFVIMYLNCAVKQLTATKNAKKLKILKSKGEKHMKITKDMLIGDVLDIDTGCAQYFFEIGMHCLGCPASRGETIEQACQVHGTDCEALVEKLNKYFENK